MVSLCLQGMDGDLAHRALHLYLCRDFTAFLQVLLKHVYSHLGDELLVSFAWRDDGLGLLLYGIGLGIDLVLGEAALRFL